MSKNSYLLDCHAKSHPLLFGANALLSSLWQEKLMSDIDDMFLSLKEKQEILVSMEKWCLDYPLSYDETKIGEIYEAASYTLYFRLQKGGKEFFRTNMFLCLENPKSVGNKLMFYKIDDLAEKKFHRPYDFWDCRFRLMF